MTSDQHLHHASCLKASQQLVGDASGMTSVPPTDGHIKTINKCCILNNDLH